MVEEQVEGLKFFIHQLRSASVSFWYGPQLLTMAFIKSFTSKSMYVDVMPHDQTKDHPDLAKREPSSLNTMTIPSIFKLICIHATK